MQEVIEGLTQPLDDEDLKGVSFDRSTPRLLDADTEENLQRALRRGALDRPPADRAADRGARRGDAGRHEPRARRGGRAGCARPTFREYWEYTVEKVAVNAVMAGAGRSTCRSCSRWPRAACRARSSTTTSFATDGGGQRADPQRDRHEHRASARWGPTTTPTRRSAAPTACCRRTSRAARRQARPTWARRATPTPTTPRFAENEERSPWEPFHDRARLRRRARARSACSSAAGTSCSARSARTPGRSASGP